MAAYRSIDRDDNLNGDDAQEQEEYFMGGHTMYTGNGDETHHEPRTAFMARGFGAWRQWILAWSMVMFMLSGCTMVGPDFVKPTAPVLEEWMEAQAPGVSHGSADYSSWWHVFDDPVLNRLIEKAYHQNLSLQVAGIRIYEARAQLGIAVGNLYPQEQSALGDFTNNRLPENDDLTIFDTRFNELSLGFDAAWELDIWGRYRRSVQSGMANLGATVASYDNVLVSLTAEVARVYIVIRTLEKRLVVAEENVALQTRSLKIAESRASGGVVSELDVTQARSLLRDTQSTVPRLKSSLRQAGNALAILLGMLPGTLEEALQSPGGIPIAAEPIIIDIPNNLLRRRPDIRLSELQVASQSPQIGIAKADLYPHFFLFGTIGWRSSDATSVSGQNDLGDIFNSKSLFWRAGPGFTWDIFNYGRIRNSVRVEDARFQQLVVNYKDTVLNAQREVADALAAFTHGREEEQFLKESVAAGQRSVDIALVQYKEGLVDYQRVLDSQRFLFTQMDKLTDVSGQVVTSLVATYKALGGGWEIRKGKPILSANNRDEMLERTNWGGLLDAEEPDLPVDVEGRGDWRWPDW